MRDVMQDSSEHEINLVKKTITQGMYKNGNVKLDMDQKLLCLHKNI